jgi:hypothetical protein
MPLVVRAHRVPIQILWTYTLILGLLVASATASAERGIGDTHTDGPVMKYMLRRHLFERSNSCAALERQDLSGGEAKKNVTVLYVPRFHSVGAGDLGQHVTTILTLQIWISFRQWPEHNPHKQNFGLGLVVWGNNEGFGLSYEDLVNKALALRTIRGPRPADLVLLGRAYGAADGAVIQATLVILPAGTRPAHPNPLWRIVFRGRERKSINEALIYDVPERVILFSPVALSNRLIGEYIDPSTLAIYDSPKLKKIVGTVNDGMTARLHSGDVVKVISHDRIVGYIKLPHLLESQNLISNFTSGLMRVFRGDLEGSLEYFDKVLSAGSASDSLKTTTLLYKGFVLDHISKDGGPEFERARKLAPSSAAAAIYRAMHILQAIENKFESHSNLTLTEEISKFNDAVTEAEKLISADDPWLIQAKRISEMLQVSDR